jgi:hypothetical protein
MVRDTGAERVILAEPEDVLEGCLEKDCVGLPVDVFDSGPLRVGLGLEEDVFERAELALCVLDDVILRVAVAVDVSVLDVAAVTVLRGLAEEVFDVAPVAVATQVGLMDFVEVELGEGSRVPASERVDVVVLVDVFDCVAVRVGMMPRPRRFRSSMKPLVFHGLVATDPIAASNKSQRIVLLQSYTSKFRYA